jgi:hypothetical protein
MYKSGALCYRDCSVLGMYNCGIGACSGDKDSCNKEIENVATSLLSSTSGSPSIPLTYDQPAAVKGKVASSLKSTLSTTARVTLKTALTQLKKVSNSSLKESILTRAKDFLNSKVTLKSDLTVVTAACQNFWETSIQKINSENDGQGLSNKLSGTVDVFVNSKITVSCDKNTDRLSNCLDEISKKTS